MRENMNLLTQIRAAILITLSASTMCNAQNAIELADGVVISAKSQLIYSADENGRLVAHSSSDGKLFWTSSETAWPLAIIGEQLYALGGSDGDHRAVLLTIKASDGRKLQSSVIEFPNNVKPDWRASPAGRFSVQWRSNAALLKSEPDPVLYWQYQSQPVRGAEIADQPAPVSLEGGLRLQINDAAIQAKPLSRAELSARPIESPDLLANEQIAGLPLPQFKSATPETVMTSKAVSDSVFGTVYQWRVVQRSDQSSLARVELPYSFAPHWVDDQQLLVRLEPYGYLNAKQQPVLHQRRIASFDLKTGSERWSFLVYDTRFTGVLPP
jgi:outer membrane protein assembly factor BamB